MHKQNTQTIRYNGYDITVTFDAGKFPRYNIGGFIDEVFYSLSTAKYFIDNLKK